MLRRIGGLFSLLSAMLCIGVIVLAVRSRHHADLLLIKTPGSHVAGAVTDHGALLLASSDMPFDGSVSVNGSMHSIAFISLSPEEFQPMRDTILDPTTTKFSFLGFKTAAGQATMISQISPRFAAIRIPCWFLAIVFAILPLGVGRGVWTQFRRRRKGLCLGCGYDIRASETRCPECGREIPSQSVKNRASADIA